MIELALFHPSRLFSEGLASILRQTPYKLVFQSETLEAIPIETLRFKSNLIFLVGGQTSAQVEAAVRAIRDRLSFAHVLVVGASAEPEEVMAALEAGADGYLGETTTSNVLVMAIDLLLRGETVLPAQFIKSLADKSIRTSEPSPGGTVVADTRLIVPNKQLSTREESILHSLVDGAPNKAIAQKLSITEATVKLHVKAILRKIRAQNRTQAAIWAAKHLRREDVALMVRNP